MAALLGWHSLHYKVQGCKCCCNTTSIEHEHMYKQAFSAVTTGRACGRSSVQGKMDRDQPGTAGRTLHASQHGRRLKSICK